MAWGDEIIALGPASGARLLGLAVDLGTTKIAAYLVDLGAAQVVRAGAALNPQISFGEDVVSRIGYATSSPEHYQQIRKAPVAAISRLAAELTAWPGPLRGRGLPAP